MNWFSVHINNIPIKFPLKNSGKFCLVIRVQIAFKIICKKEKLDRQWHTLHENIFRE